MGKRGNPNWVKGVSGNPGGRHKGVKDVQDLARQHTADAIKTLVAICKRGQSEAARVAAASAILDRAYGKPTQTVNAHVRRSLVTFTDEELATIAAGGSEGDVVEEEGEEKLQSVH